MANENEDKKPEVPKRDQVVDPTQEQRSAINDKRIAQESQALKDKLAAKRKTKREQQLSEKPAERAGVSQGLGNWVTDIENSIPDGPGSRTNQPPQLNWLDELNARLDRSLEAHQRNKQPQEPAQPTAKDGDPKSKDAPESNFLYRGMQGVLTEAEVEAKAARAKKEIEEQEAQFARTLVGQEDPAERKRRRDPDIGLTVPQDFTNGVNDNHRSVLSQPVDGINALASIAPAAGQPVLADSVAPLGNGANDPGSKSMERAKGIAKVLGGVAVSVGTTMAMKAGLTLAIGAAFPAAAAAAPIIVASAFLLWSGSKIASSASKFYKEMKAEGAAIGSAEGVSSPRAMLRAINKNKVKFGILLGSAVMLGWAGANTDFSPVGNAIGEAFDSLKTQASDTYINSASMFMGGPSNAAELLHAEAAQVAATTPDVAAAAPQASGTSFIEQQAIDQVTGGPLATPALDLLNQPAPSLLANNEAIQQAAERALPLPDIEPPSAPIIAELPQDEFKAFIDGKDVSPEVREAAESMSSSNPAVAAQAAKDAAFFLINERGVEGNSELAVALLKDAAEHGNVQAQTDLAYLHYHGLEGMEADKPVALAEMQKIDGERALQFVEAWQATGTIAAPAAEIAVSAQSSSLIENVMTYDQRLAAAEAGTNSTDVTVAVQAAKEYADLIANPPTASITAPEATTGSHFYGASPAATQATSQFGVCRSGVEETLITVQNHDHKPDTAVAATKGGTAPVPRKFNV